MDNYQMVVGSKDCPLRKVFLIVQQSSAIQSEWSIFAIQLDVPSAQIKKFRKDLHLDKLTLGDVILEILEIWIARKSSEATLGNLLQVVEGHCGTNDVGELLRLEYKLPCKEAEDNPSIEWKDLSPAFQKRVEETFQHFTPNLKHEEVLLKLTGAALVTLMEGKKPHILGIPEELSYYVSRKVVTRNIISAQIFDQHSSDIFLFTGIDRYELSRLAKKRITGSSRQQLQSGVNVKLMILDQENHFERICGKTNHPVHLLRREGNGKLRWVKSKRGMDNLRKYIQQDQDELNEEQFCQMSPSKTLPVLICDTPGMGKSVLLAHISRRLVQLHPERNILFIVLSKFIEYGKSLEMDDKLRMVELTLQNWTGVALQQSKLDLNDETILIELLLDGYDEVDVADRKLALEILQAIRKYFKCIRLWITSRPHLMDQLENSLNVLGYNIRPFHEENQVHFLSSFWSAKIKIKLDQEKVHLFAQKCLKSLKATMNATDHDIAGIPLQCLMIGEVYEDDAADYAKMGTENVSSSLLEIEIGIDALEFAKVNKEICSCASIEIEIGTIPNLYHQLIKKKFKKYKSAFGIPKLKDDDLMTIYTHLSLEVLFPVEHGILKLTKAAEIDVDEVVKGGILTSTRIGGITILHRTFAEYFVAWFVFDKLQQEEEWTPELLNLFFTILSCSKLFNLFNLGSEMVTKFKFTHPVICFFLDSMLANIPLEILPNNFPSKSNDKHLESFKGITRACIGENFVQIFKLIDARCAFANLAAIVFTIDLLLLGVRNSSVELVESILARFERHHNFDLEVQKATLREAVKRGKFSILEFLIKEKRLRGIVEDFGDKDTNLVCDCVAGTSRSSEEEINEKILVLQTLVEIKGSLVDGRNGSSTAPPLLAKYAHLKLLIELIRLGANAIVQNDQGETVLHLDLSASPSREDYHHLVMSIPMDNLTKLINLQRTLGATPLTSILRCFDPLPETLDIFHVVGADFNHVDEDGSTVLTFAIKTGRNAETIRKLIQLGAHVKSHFLGFLRPFRNTNLLHVAAQSGNLDAVGVLLDECKIHVNSMDDDERTPLDHAIDNILSSSSSDKHERFSELSMTLIERGGRFKKFAEFLRKSLLHVVLTNNLESVKLLVQLGIYKVAECERSSLSLGDRYSIIQHLLENGSNPSALNNRNETPFHAFLRNKEGHDFNIFQLFKSKWDERSLWTPTIATLALGYAAMDDAFPDNDFESFARECEANEADFNWKDDKGNSLLHLAAKNGKASTVLFLIKNKGVDVNSKNNSKESPLHQAASSEQNTCLEVIKCLIENGANLLEITDHKDSILHLAAFYGTAAALRYFLELGGADINGKDLDGDTPFHCAIGASNNSSEKSRLLIEYGADVRILNSNSYIVPGEWQ